MSRPSVTGGTFKKREWASWYDMIQRCYNPKHNSYYLYGAKGITVCDRWRGKDGFKNFFVDIGVRPDKTTIDRINSKGHYNKANCRWATAVEQQNNRTNNVNITHNGKTQTLQQWVNELGLSRKRVGQRLDLGWDFEKAISEPPKNVGVRARQQSLLKKHSMIASKTIILKKKS